MIIRSWLGFGLRACPGARRRSGARATGAKLYCGRAGCNSQPQCRAPGDPTRHDPRAHRRRPAPRPGAPGQRRGPGSEGDLRLRLGRPHPLGAGAARRAGAGVADGRPALGSLSDQRPHRRGRQRSVQRMAVAGAGAAVASYLSGQRGVESQRLQPVGMGEQRWRTRRIRPAASTVGSRSARSTRSARIPACRAIGSGRTAEVRPLPRHGPGPGSRCRHEPAPRPDRQPDRRDGRLGRAQGHRRRRHPRRGPRARRGAARRGAGAPRAGGARRGVAGRGRDRRAGCDGRRRAGGARSDRRRAGGGRARRDRRRRDPAGGRGAGRTRRRGGGLRRRRRHRAGHLRACSASRPRCSASPAA